MHQLIQCHRSYTSERRYAAKHLPGNARNAAVLVGLFILVWTGCVDVPVPDPQVRYIAFGDSTTAGPSGSDYADILRELLAEPTETFVNEGSGGETASEGLERLRFLLDHQVYPNAHTLLYWEGGAQIVDFIAKVDPFLLLSPDSSGYPFSSSLNQLLNDIQGQVEAVIEVGHNAGLAVYVTTYFMLPPFILPCDQMFLDIILPGQANNGSVYITMLNERLRQAATKKSGILVDIAAIEELAANPGNYFDCNHLSVEGNRIVAERFFKTLSGTTGAE